MLKKVDRGEKSLDMAYAAAQPPPSSRGPSPRPTNINERHSFAVTVGEHSFKKCSLIPGPFFHFFPKNSVLKFEKLTALF